MITAATTPLYFEDAVAARLGLSRDDIRYLRRELLQPKKEWHQLERKIVLSQPAVEKLLARVRQASNTLPAALDFSACLRPSALEKKESAPGLVLLTVRRLMPNTRILMANTTAGELVHVQVVNSANFRPNMTLHARQIGPLKFKMEGRCPRQPGRY